ncbi:MAG: hypothetical protein ACXVB9_06440 [Bdellovibrionota bacterium]
MKKLAIAMLALIVAPSSFAAASAKTEHFSEARCFDIKQSVITDLPHFCGSAKAEKARSEDFGHQIDLLAKKCEQPQLARLLKKAVAERAAKNEAACTAEAEKMVKPSLSKASAHDSSTSSL